MVSSALAWLLILLGGAVLWMTALRSIWPVLDIAAPLTFQALAAVVIGTVALLLRWGRGIFLFGCLGVLAIGPSLLTLDARESASDVRLPWHQASITRDAVPTLRLLAINTWHENESLETLRRYIARADADVVVLSEFGPNKRELLARLKRRYPYQVSCAEEWACSQALISRIKFHDSGSRMPDLEGPPLVWAEFRFGESQTNKLTVFGTHIYRPSRRFDWHRAQLAGLARIVQRTEGAIVVAGDFNMTRLSQSFTDFSIESNLHVPSRPLASWPAWPLPLPQVQFDHVFVSRDIDVLQQRIGALVGSDHLPLWSAIRLPDKATLIAHRRGDAPEPRPVH